MPKLTEIDSLFGGLYGAQGLTKISSFFLFFRVPSDMTSLRRAMLKNLTVEPLDYKTYQITHQQKPREHH